MAGRIAGITIEIGGDTTNLQKSLKGVDSTLKTTQASLRDVNKLLKLDPTNTVLLNQKHQLLKDTVSQTKDRLDKLKEAQAQMDANGVDKNSAQYQALQREIIETEAALSSAEKAASKFHPQLEKIKAAAESASAGLKEAADKTKALSTAAAGALASLIALGVKAGTNADDLNTMAKQTGFTTEELQKMQYAADRIDVSMEDIVGALKKFKTKIDPANKALQKLGVSTTNADGSTRDATEVFWDAIEALSGIENETEKDQLAMELFGKSADSLAGIIDDGGQSLKEYGDEAENLGLILGQDTLDSLNETNDTIDRMKIQITGIMGVIGSKVLPVLEPILTKAAELVATVAEKVGSLSPETMKVILAVIALVAALSPVLSLLASLATAIAFLASPVGIAIIAIGALIAIGVALYKNWDTIKATAEAVASNVATNWETLKSDVSTAMETAKTAIQTAWDTIKTKVTTTASNILTRVRTSFNNIRTAITSPIERAKTTITNAIDKIKGLFPLSVGKIFSDIKLPHFSLSKGEAPYGWMGKGSMPSLSISWYKKAMQNPVLLRGASIFGAMNNRLLGGGEAGTEVILSYDKLAKMLGSSGDNVVINVYASQGMDVNALADKIQQRFVRMNNQRRAVHA